MSFDIFADIRLPDAATGGRCRGVIVFYAALCQCESVNSRCYFKVPIYIDTLNTNIVRIARNGEVLFEKETPSMTIS